VLRALWASGYVLYGMTDPWSRQKNDPAKRIRRAYIYIYYTINWPCVHVTQSRIPCNHNNSMCFLHPVQCTYNMYTCYVCLACSHSHCRTYWTSRCLSMSWIGRSDAAVCCYVHNTTQVNLLTYTQLHLRDWLSAAGQLKSIEVCGKKLFCECMPCLFKTGLRRQLNSQTHNSVIVTQWERCLV
jgi:hypothetical protein